MSNDECNCVDYIMIVNLCGTVIFVIMLQLSAFRFIACAMTSKGFSLADSSDRHMLDVAGIDPHTPYVIQQFVNNII